MQLAFDHLIHYIKDPEEVFSSLKKIGISNHKGGRHESLGTSNTLTHFGLRYIEYLGIDDHSTYEKAISKASEYSPVATINRKNEKEGFHRIALRSHDLNRLATNLQKHGVITEGPTPLSRRTTSGELLEWELLYAGSEQSELELPFFIDWKKADDDRLDQLEKSGLLAPHGAGKITFNYVLFGVTDFTRSYELWKKWFQCESKSSYIDEKLNSEVYTLTLDGFELRFAKPLGDGVVKTVVDKQGPSIFEIGFSGVKEPKQVQIYGGDYSFFEK